MSCPKPTNVTLDIGCIPPAHRILGGNVDCSVNPPILKIDILNEKNEDVSISVPLCIVQDWIIDKDNVTQQVDAIAKTFFVTIPCIDRRSGESVGSFQLDFSKLFVCVETDTTCIGSSGNEFLVKSLTLNDGVITENLVADHSALHEVVDLPPQAFGEFVGGDPAIAVLEDAPAPSYQEVKFTNPNPCREMRGTVYSTASFAADVIANGGTQSFYVIGQSLYIDGVLIPARDGRNLPGYNVTQTTYTEEGGSGISLVQGITDHDLPIIYWNVTIPPGETICVGQDVGFSITFPGTGERPANVSIESRQIGIIANTV